MGGAAGMVMLLGLIRSKIAALLIGTTGIGLLGSFTAIQTLASTFSGFGLGASAVRKISASFSSNDYAEIGRSVFVLRRLSLVSGIIGLCLLIIFSPAISKLTFGDYRYTLDVASLGIVVLVGNIAAAYLAVLQGMRCIADIARVNIYSATVGAASALILYIPLESRGIVPGLILASFAQFAFAYYFSRKLNIELKEQSWKQIFSESKLLLSLGFSFMWGGVLVSGLGYLTIYLINKFENVHAVGLYAAAYAISGAFVNFILGAMSTDYYPRLAGTTNDKAAMIRLVNHQTEIGVLLVTPGLLAGVLFAPWIIVGLYSSEFELGAPLLQWFLVGALGRVISWPMGFVILALGKARWFMIYETSLNVLHAALIAVALIYFDLKGVAFSFCVINIISILILYIIANKAIDFSWSASSKRLIFASIFLVACSLIISTATLPFSNFWVGFPFLSMVSVVSLRLLVERVGRNNNAMRYLSRFAIVRFIVGS